jgi:hypothetical protein
MLSGHNILAVPDGLIGLWKEAANVALTDKFFLAGVTLHTTKQLTLITIIRVCFLLIINVVQVVTQIGNGDDSSMTFFGMSFIQCVKAMDLSCSCIMSFLLLHKMCSISSMVAAVSLLLLGMVEVISLFLDVNGLGSNFSSSLICSSFFFSSSFFFFLKAKSLNGTIAIGIIIGILFLKFTLLMLVLFKASLKFMLNTCVISFHVISNTMLVDDNNINAIITFFLIVLKELALEDTCHS